MRNVIALGAALSVVFACGARTDEGEAVFLGDAGSHDSGVSQDASAGDALVHPTPAPVALLSNACGPTDAPAFLLRVATEPLSCGMTAPPATRDELSGPGTIPDSAQSLTFSGPDVFGESCTNNNCVTATAVKIVFDSVTPMSASGSYTLALPGGKLKTAKFAASRCAGPVTCG